MPDERRQLTVAELEWELEKLSEECRRQEALQLEWTGNLGRWQWEVPTNQVRFNPWKVRALGYGEHEVEQPVGFEFFTHLLHPDDHEPVMNNMRRHLYGESDAYEVEYRIRAKDGTWRWYFDRGVVSRRGPNGEPLMVCGIVFDVTEKMTLQAELKRRNEELAALWESRNRFFALLAHDLRGSIGGVVRVLDMIQSHSLAQVDEDEALGLVSESAHVTFQLLENLLHWASVQSGQKVLALEPTRVTALVEGAVGQSAAQALAKSIRVEVAAESDVVALVDPSAGQTVFRNLVANAIKFSPPGHPIEVTVQQEGAWAKVAVADHGIGISSDRLENLLDGAGLVSTPGTLGERGTGLGLILCRELVQKCGGTLMVSSAEGEGSLFTVLLPLVP